MVKRNVRMKDGKGGGLSLFDFHTNWREEEVRDRLANKTMTPFINHRDR